MILGGRKEANLGQVRVKHSKKLWSEKRVESNKTEFLKEGNEEVIGKMILVQSWHKTGVKPTQISNKLRNLDIIILNIFFKYSYYTV